MDLERLFKRVDKVDRQIDWVIDLAFILVAAGFGGWLVWTVLGAGGASLTAQIGASLVGAAISAGLMWLFWLIARVIF